MLRGKLLSLENPPPSRSPPPAALSCSRKAFRRTPRSPPWISATTRWERKEGLASLRSGLVVITSRLRARVAVLRGESRSIGVFLLCNVDATAAVISDSRMSRSSLRSLMDNDDASLLAQRTHTTLRAMSGTNIYRRLRSSCLDHTKRTKDSFYFARFFPLAWAAESPTAPCRELRPGAIGHEQRGRD